MAKVNASEVSEKAKSKLRPTVKMGGTTSHNGKPDSEAMEKKSQAHHESNLAKRRTTSDGYMPRKLEVKHENTEKDSARLKMSKTTKRGETRMGGQGAKQI